MKSKYLSLPALFILALSAVLVLGSIQGIVWAADTGASDAGNEIPVEKLLQTRAVNLFQSGDYAQALPEFQALGRQYPEDILLMRYVGMTLILLGRLDEAAAIFQEAIKKDPKNPALHYYLARTYHEQGARKKAESELDEVLALDLGGFYGQPAREALSFVQQKSLVKKKWDLFAASGYEYDSNVILNPNDKALRSQQDQSAGRYFLSANGSYRYIEKPRFDLQAGYRFYQSFHDDSLNEFNYDSHDFFHVFRYRFQALSREITAGLRNSIPLGFLNGHLFITGIENTAFFNSRLTKNTFTEIYHRYSHYEFGPDGPAPQIFSRDGEYNASGITHRYHFSDFRRYVFTGYEFETGAARGNNFDHLGHRIQLGFHTPITLNLLFDIIGSLDVANYPHYSAAFVPREPLARRDNDWAILVRLTYILSKNWSLQFYYRYEYANNPNDLFQYDRHITGTQLSARY